MALTANNKPTRTILTATPSDNQLLDISTLATWLAISIQSINDRLNKQSPRFDPTFPRPFKLGRRASRWQAREVMDWIAHQMKTRRQEEELA